MVVVVAVVGILLKPKTAISARNSLALIQVDIDLGMPESSSSSITCYLASLNKRNGHVFDRVNRGKWVRLKSKVSLLKSGSNHSINLGLLLSAPCRIGFW